MTFIGVDICPKQDAGLCNQLYSIIAQCLLLYNSNKNSELSSVVLIGKFLKSINTTDFCNINEIINIDKTNLYLKKYNIYLIDVYNFSYQITNIYYCIDSVKINITNLFDTQIKNKSLIIPIDYPFNKLDDVILKTRPINDTMNKYIDIDYVYNSICNNSIKYEIKNNKLLNEINTNTLTLIPNFTYEQDLMFIDILQNVIFNDIFLYKANHYMSNIVKKNEKINCIHLRLENDAMSSWSRQNNIDINKFKEIVENKYISSIEKYFDKNDKILVLSYDYNNRVIDFLTQNEYNFIITTKMYKERELSAITDLHIGNYCNNNYIFIFESSYSFTLLKRILNKNTNKNTNKIKAIMIEYMNIFSPERIYDF